MSNSNTVENKTQSVILKTTAERSAFGAKTQGDFLFMGSLIAPHYDVNNVKRAPLDLIAVIDRSGSMAGEKLSLVKETMHFVVKQLTDSDRLGVIAYDDTVTISLELTNMNANGKKIATDAINGIHDGGSTNLCGGLVGGIELLRKRTTKNEVSSVLLFTDGLANAGYTSAQDIIRATTDAEFAKRGGASPSPSVYQYQQQQQMPPIQMNVQPNFIPQMPMQQQQQQQQVQQMPQMYGQMPMQQQVQQMPQMYGQMPQPMYGQMPMQQQVQQMPQQIPTLKPQSMEVSNSNSTTTETKHEPLPCTINTFGFGSDHDPKLLTAIAQSASGVYYFIEKTENIPEAFADCLGGLLSVCGQNITFKIEAGPETTIKKVLTKFKTNVISPDKVIELSLGDIQSDETRDIIAIAQLPMSAVTDSFHVAKITLSYFNVITLKLETSSVDVCVQRPEVTSSAVKVDFELDKQRNRFLSAEAMEKASDLGSKGQYEQARNLIKATISQIKESVSSSDSFCKDLILDLEKCASGLQDTTAFQNFGNQMLHNNYMAHYNQRSTNVQMPSQQAYNAMPARQMMQAQVKSINQHKP